MGRPKKNKKAEIKARRKTRKAQERVADLRHREKRARAYLKVLTENAETLKKLAEAEKAEAESNPSNLDNDSEISDPLDDQNTQSPSE
tara:strand:- start:94 stop:357 length:264 start_codon:yes stop_codon:yes gene_type:complete